MVQRKAIHYLGFTFRKLGKLSLISLNAPLSIIPALFVVESKDWIVLDSVWMSLHFIDSIEFEKLGL